DVILKMGDTSDACKSFSAHVCKAKTDYSIKTLEKIGKDVGDAKVADTWKGVGLSEAVKNYIAVPGGDPQDAVPMNLPGIDESEGFDITGSINPARLAAAMALRGIDGFIRAVHVRGNTSGNQDIASMLELGAPIEDMYPYVMLDMADTDLKSTVPQWSPEDDNGNLVKLPDFITSFNQLVISKTSTSRQHIPRFIPVSLLKSNHSSKGWDWAEFFKGFEDIGVDYVTDDSIVRVAHPDYIFALSTFFDGWAAK
ncbi:hypothetical protein MTO96_024173, partial [Rhipicephalus appendiculatus]